MPIVSQFYGIVITMYYNDTEKHHLPHLHAAYGEYSAVYNFEGNCVRAKHIMEAYPKRKTIF